MNTVLIVLASLMLITYYLTQHIYKCDYNSWNNMNIGLILGSIIGDIVHMICCWYIIKNILE